MGKMNFITLFLFVLIIFSVKSQNTIQFGQTCEDGIEGECDRSKGLACIENQCVCSRPYSMMYNETLQKCLILSSELCDYYGLDDSDSGAQCVQNAECSFSHALFANCICKNNYFEDLDGYCLPRRLLGENCSKEAKCREDLLLACYNDRCSCKTNVASLVINGDQKSCANLVGSFCVSSSLRSEYNAENDSHQCVLNAFCERRLIQVESSSSISLRPNQYTLYEQMLANTHPDQNFLYPNRKPFYRNISINECACSDGYVAKDGFCFGTYNQSCNLQDSYCVKGLNCLDGKCKCYFPTHQHYDPESNQCISYANGPCLSKQNETIHKFACVPNSECVNINGFDICSCKYDYVVSEDKTCKPHPGKSCGLCDCTKEYFDSEKDECVSKGVKGDNCTVSSDCRKDLGFSCLNGICSCIEPKTVYRPDINRCAGLPGYTCVGGRHCTEDAKCVRHYRGSICECLPDLKKSKSGKCLPSYNYKCGEEFPCIEGEGLACVNGSCQCKAPAAQEYWNGKCNCRQKYKLLKDRCLIKFGDGCEDSVPCYDGLICLGGKCLCPFPDHQFYDAENNICVSLIRGPCMEYVNSALQNYSCVDNAVCAKSSEGIPQCQCKESYIESENRKCEIAYGHPCPTHKGCDSIAGLICKDQICTCPNLQGYDEKRRKCRGLVGALCEMPSEHNIGFCVDRASCDLFPGSSKDKKGVCKCNFPEETRVVERNCVRKGKH